MHHSDSDLSDSGLLSSSWLIYMLAKSSNTPEGRLLSLFEILNDWLKAPTVTRHAHLGDSNYSLLLSYCTEQAKALGADSPALLAEHIVLIARNAAEHSITNPASNSLAHAKKAAHALIQAQTQPTTVKQNKTRFVQPVSYGIAATLVLAIAASVIWAPLLNERSTSNKNVAVAIDQDAVLSAKEKPQLNAHDATQMYAKYELMRQGTCQFPEALLMPDKHKAIYLENVVGGKLPSNLEDLAIANQYLEKIKCNFTPMLMAASK